MGEDRIIWDAEFNASVTTYWLLGGALILTVSVVGIVLVPFWFLIGGLITRRYLATFRCTLTSRSLQVAKGLFVKIEKTVPLDRITDLAIVQGPIMRLFNIEALSVETAGQSSPGSLVQLAGIQNGREFRDAVLNQRDLVVGSEEERKTAAGGGAGELPDGSQQLLEQIRDTLVRIENKMGGPS